MDPYLAEIRLFAGNFAPLQWALCNGALLSIAQNTALFSLLGTTYGGDGQTTFALPDLRGRFPFGTGQGPGLSPVNLGEVAGVGSVTLTAAQMPQHTHGLAAVGAPANALSPAGAVLAAVDEEPIYGGSGNTTMAAGLLGAAGGNQPFSLVNPYCGLNYIICVEGIYPSRN